MTILKNVVTFEGDKLYLFTLFIWWTNHLYILHFIHLSFFTVHTQWTDLLDNLYFGVNRSPWLRPQLYIGILEGLSSAKSFWKGTANLLRQMSKKRAVYIDNLLYCKNMLLYANTTMVNYLVLKNGRTTSRGSSGMEKWCSALTISIWICGQNKRRR